MTINELRTKRATAWEAAKAFLDSHRTDKGILSAEDETMRAFRVALTAATRTVLGNAFELICLRKIEQI